MVSHSGKITRKLPSRRSDTSINIVTRCDRPDFELLSQSSPSVARSCSQHSRRSPLRLILYLGSPWSPTTHCAYHQWQLLQFLSFISLNTLAYAQSRLKMPPKGAEKPIFKGLVIALACPMGGQWTDANISRWVGQRNGAFTSEMNDTVTHLICSSEEFKKKCPRGKSHP